MEFGPRRPSSRADACKHHFRLFGFPVMPRKLTSSLDLRMGYATSIQAIKFTLSNQNLSYHFFLLKSYYHPTDMYFLNCHSFSSTRMQVLWKEALKNILPWKCSILYKIEKNSIIKPNYPLPHSTNPTKRPILLHLYTHPLPNPWIILKQTLDFITFLL